MKNNPYVGPRPYEKRDRDNFYGRDREAQELFSLVVSEREVLFYAQSGAGKTSLLNARVIPALEEEGFLVLPVARVGSALPLGIVNTEVENIFAFSTLLSLTEGNVAPKRLRSYTLLSFLQAFHPRSEDNESKFPILIFDQFEEVFTTHHDRWEDAQGFFLQIRKTLDGLPNLGMVFVMREDHIAGIDPYVMFFPRRLHARFRMEHLGPKGALAAVRRPAESAGCPFDDGVAERLVDDLRRIKVQRSIGVVEETTLGPYVEPVQLQVVCSRLWDNLPEQADNAIQWKEIEEYGNVDRALTDFYESALEAVVTETGVNERVLRRWFGQRLITPMGTRGLVLREPEETADLPNAAVDVLEGQHLIRADRRSGVRWYELSHDRLIDPIVQSNQAWDLEQEQKMPWRLAARRWKETGDGSLLYRGAALAEALDWIAEKPDEAESDELEFLMISQKAERARIRRRNLYAFFGIVAVIVIVLMTTLWRMAKKAGAEAQNQTAIALSRQLAVQSIEQASASNLELAVLLATEAGRTAETADAFDALRQATVHLGRTLFTLPGDNAWWSADGSRIFTAGCDHRDDGDACLESAAWVWDAETGGELVALPYDGRIYQAVWRADGHRILTVSDDGLVQVWDAETGDELLAFSIRMGKNSWVAWNTDGSHILIVDCERKSDSGDECLKHTVQVRDAATGDPLVQFPYEGDIYRAMWSADGRRILTVGCERKSNSEGCLEGAVQVWDFSLASDAGVGMGRELLKLPHSGHIGAAWNANSTRILTFGCDYPSESGWCSNTVWVWDAKTGDELLKLSYNGQILHAAWSADGNHILTRDSGGTVHVWDMEAGDELFGLPFRMGRDSLAAWSVDGSRILTASSDGTVWVWDVSDALNTGMLTEAQLELFAHIDPVNQAAWNADGSRILTAGCERKSNSGDECLEYTVRVWDAAIGGELSPSSGYRGDVNQAAWSADGSRILTAGCDRKDDDDKCAEGTVRVWDVVAQDALLTLAGKRAWWSSDNRYILTASDAGVAQVWDAQTGTELFALLGITNTIDYAAWNADGSRILIKSSDSIVHIWDAHTGDLLFDLPHHGTIYQATWNADGSRILTAGCDREDDNDRCAEGTARVWDAHTGAELLIFSGPADKIYQAAWNANESRILTLLSNGDIWVWDAKTGGKLFELPYKGYVVQAAWNTDGNRVLTRLSSGEIWVWDAATEGALFMLPGHIGSYGHAMWDTDSSRILTAGCDRKDDDGVCQDGSVQVWDVTTALNTGVATRDALLFSLPDHIGPSTLAAWNVDGSRILTAGCDQVDNDSKCLKSSVHQWFTRIEDWSQEACLRAPRNMSWEEWQRYFGSEPYRKTCDNLPVHVSVFEGAVNQKIELAEIFALRGDAQAAASAYEEAIQRAGETSDAHLYAKICWSGIFRGAAETVLPACERAVELAPSDADYYDSRGVARALIGDFAGAVQDFKSATEHEWSGCGASEACVKRVSRRETWIVQLEVGQNPFDEETLEALRYE